MLVKVHIERVRRKLLGRLSLASLEISGFVSEIECEVQRTDQVQDHLKDVQSTRTTSQTILGVIFGGLANILSGGIGLATGAGDVGNIASTTGGALEVLFGTPCELRFAIEKKFAEAGLKALPAA